MDCETSLPPEGGYLVPLAQVAPSWHANSLGVRERLAVGTLLVVGTLLRLWGLSAKSLWIDETFSIGIVSQSWPSFIHTLLFVQPNMETYYMLQKIAASVTPTSWQHGEFFWRLIPALAGGAVIIPVYLLARRLFDIRTALLAATLVTLNEFMVEYSQQARGYTLFVLVLTLSYYALIRWLVDGQRRALIAFAVLSAIGFLTQAFEVVFLVGQIALVVCVMLRGRRVAWRAGLLALVPLLLIIALRYPVYAAHPDQVSWIQRPTMQDLVIGVMQLAGGSGGTVPLSAWLVLSIAIVALGIVAASTLAFIRGEQRDAPFTWGQQFDRCEANSAILLWVLVPVLGTWVGSQVKPVWVTRYLAPASIGICLIVAVAIVITIDRLSQRSSRQSVSRDSVVFSPSPLRLARGSNADSTFPIQPNPIPLSGATESGLGGQATRNVIAVLAVVALLSVWLVPLQHYLTRPAWEDWRGAAHYVATNFAAADGIVCYDNQWGCDFGVSHYFVSMDVAAHLDPQAPGAFSWETYSQQNREATFAQAVTPDALTAYARKHGRVWLVLGHYTAGQGDWQTGLAWLAAHAHQMTKVVFAGDIEVYQYDFGGN